MTRAQARRYLRLAGQIGGAWSDLPPVGTPGLLRGHTKRRATMAAKRLMKKSRDLWRLLSGLSP